MVSGIIVTTFLVIIGICGIVFGIFMWMNFRSSSLDTRAYDENFDAGDMMSRYRMDKGDQEEDPYQALKRFELNDNRSAPASSSTDSADPAAEPLEQSSHGLAAWSPDSTSAAEEPVDPVDELLDKVLGPGKPE